MAASVEGLRPEQVVIIDSTGRSLARGAIGSDDGAMAGADIERQQKYERDMAMKVVALLEPVVGVERVRANVSVHLHGSSQEQTREEFDPSTVLRSEQTTIEGSSAESSGGVAGAQANLPPPVRPDGTPAAAAPSPASTSSRGLTRSSKVSNYEVTKTVTHSIRPRGEVAKVSVAVLVDDEHVVQRRPGRHGDHQAQATRPRGDAEAAEARGGLARHRHAAWRPGHRGEHRLRRAGARADGQRHRCGSASASRAAARCESSRCCSWSPWCCSLSFGR